MKRWFSLRRVTVFLGAIGGLVLVLGWPGWLVNSWQVWEAKKALGPVVEQISAYQRGNRKYPDKIDEWLPARLPVLLRQSNNGGVLYRVSSDWKSYSLDFPDREDLQPSDREYIQLYMYTEREGWIHLHTLRDRSQRP